LLLCQGQRARVPEADRALACERVGVLAWTTAPAPPIVGRAHGPYPAHVRGVGGAGWQVWRLGAPPWSGLALPREPWLTCGGASRQRGGGRPSALATVRGWEQDRCHALRETVQGERTAEGTDHPTLRDATARGMAAPLLHVSRLQERRPPPEHALSMPVLPKHGAPHRMVSTVTTWCSSARNAPWPPLPGCRARPPRRLTATPRTAPRGVPTARRCVVCLHHGASAVLAHVV